MARYIETIEVCIWRMLVCCNDCCVVVSRNVCYVAAVVKYICFVLECCVDVMDVVFSVCIVRRGAVGARV